MAKKSTQERYQDLLKEQEQLIAAMEQHGLELEKTRKHGKAGTVKEGEAELIRLCNNIASQNSRYKLRIKEWEDFYAGTHPDDIPDKYGITTRDTRRYKHCFGWIDPALAPEYSYIKTMTGLSVEQAEILEQRTGLIFKRDSACLAR